MLHQKIPLPEAVTLVSKKRDIYPNDGFLEQLCRLHNELFVEEAQSQSENTLKNSPLTWLTDTSNKQRFHYRKYIPMKTWRRFPHYLTFLWGMHRSPVESPHIYIYSNAEFDIYLAFDLNKLLNKYPLLVTWDVITGRELRSGVKCIVLTIVTGSLWLVWRYRWNCIEIHLASTIPSQ